MLKRNELDQIDRFLMGATLQDAIKIVHVCQALTAECRLMLDVIDQRTEDFFGANNTPSQDQVRQGGGQGSDASLVQSGDVSVGDLETLQRTVHPSRDSVGDEGDSGLRTQDDAANRGGDRGSESGGAAGLGTRGKGSEVGGKVSATQELSASGPPDDKVQEQQQVERRRGRPQKKKEQS